jgi:hypothetical protein
MKLNNEYRKNISDKQGEKAVMNISIIRKYCVFSGIILLCGLQERKSLNKVTRLYFWDV